MTEPTAATTNGNGPAASGWAPGELAPRPGAAPLGRMLLAQAATELRLTFRNGEVVLLTLVIPVLLLVLFTAVPLVDVGGRRVDFLVPGVLALAVLSTSFTGLAIATGFERQYGVLKRLGATALPRGVLIAAKSLGVLAVEAVQAVLLVAVGLSLGWSPHGSVFAVAGLLVAGTAAFAGLGLLLAGTLKALTTLVTANFIYILLLVGGGVIFPLTSFPSRARHVLGLLPVAALSDGLRAVLRQGAAAPVHDWVTLLVWAAVGLTAAARTFRWE
jgi:ABC-2 type transport system permease protein